MALDLVFRNWPKNGVNTASMDEGYEDDDEEWLPEGCDRCGEEIYGPYYAFMRVTDDGFYEEVTLCEKCGRELLEKIKQWIGEKE